MHLSPSRVYQTLAADRSRWSKDPLITAFRVSFDDLHFDTLRAEAKELEVDWSYIEEADGNGPSSQGWKDLLQLAGQAATRITDNLAQREDHPDGQNDMPILDHAVIPLITPGQRVRVSEGWIDNIHRAGKLQFRESNMHGKPWFRLLRHEVESLVQDKGGMDHLHKKKLQKESRRPQSTGMDRNEKRPGICSGCIGHLCGGRWTGAG